MVRIEHVSTVLPLAAAQRARWAKVKGRLFQSLPAKERCHQPTVGRSLRAKGRVGQSAETTEGLASPPEPTTIEVRNSMVGILLAQEFPLLFTGDPESSLSRSRLGGSTGSDAVRVLPSSPDS
jgi:hypothetical protein